ncbi:excinuclease ABC subunit UvrA, partial [Myxococcota bacterium]|nr:excinuclease ABC subunit UvrA [Myxococcota bacterium]
MEKHPLPHPQTSAGITKEHELLQIRGASEHNLKGVDIDLPKKRFIVFTGVSGSGKSSLAFDTIFAEGQRRYVESLSSYARQFIGQMDKPRYDTIRGLSPTISIDQKSANRNPRSTVGTITEIYDYLRVLYARMGEQFCVDCGKPVGRGHAQAVVDQILCLPEKTAVTLLAPLMENRKGEHHELFADLKSQGFARVRIDGVVTALNDVTALPKQKKHTIEIVVDRLVIKSGREFVGRLTDSVEQCLAFGKGRLVIHVPGRPDQAMSEALTCCGRAYPDLHPSLFSFNSPQGMCPDCNGIGTRMTMDHNKIVVDGSLSIRQGALVPWKNLFDKRGRLSRSWGG